jgi:hypothetical protein
MKAYHRAIPARGTHPGAYSDMGNVWEHDPRGYHPEWQAGWQNGYTDGYSSDGHVAAPSSGWPSGVLDEDQYMDGYRHGRNVGVYHWHVNHVHTGSIPDVPSPWWRKPNADTPDGYRLWTVQIEVDTDASTPRDAAAAAWDGLTADAPPIVSVWPTLGSPADAVEVDLSADDTHGPDDTKEPA